MAQPRTVLAWAAIGAAMTIPVLAAAFSPFLQWRGPVYIAAGFAGIVGLALLLLQPLLMTGRLPGMAALRARRLHRWVGAALVACVILHVVGLWIVSPPDVIDVLLFRSPTPFSVWGATAMWLIFAAGLLAIYRRKLRPRTWRLIHTGLAAVIVSGTIVHALLIEGAMEIVTKWGLAMLAIAATALVVGKTWQTSLRRKRQSP